MKVKKITAKEARAINRRLGMETWEDDGASTFWATDENESGCWVFDTKAERDEFVNRCNSKEA